MAEQHRKDERQTDVRRRANLQIAAYPEALRLSKSHEYQHSSIPTTDNKSSAYHILATTV